MLLRDFGEGLVETTVTIKSATKRHRPPRGEPQPLTDEQRQENRERALRRARTAIRHSVMAAKLDHLVTFTYRANQTCPRLAWQHFARFMRLLRKKRAGRPFPFVAVLERQKRGAMHIHAAVHGYHDAKMLRALWREAIGSNEGNIDIQWFRKNLATAARYLSK
ncbi:MAG: rolling circle replication-associated protein, partial [Rhodospirillaceae bacterium]